MSDSTSIYIGTDGKIVKNPCKTAIIGCPGDGSSYPSKCPKCCSFCTDTTQCEREKITVVLSGLTWRSPCTQIVRFGFGCTITSQHGNTVTLSRSPLSGCDWVNSTDLVLGYNKYVNEDCSDTPVAYSVAMNCQLVKISPTVWQFTIDAFLPYPDNALLIKTFGGYVSVTSGVCGVPPAMNSFLGNSPNEGPAYGGSATFS